MRESKTARGIKFILFAQFIGLLFSAMGFIIAMGLYSYSTTPSQMGTNIAGNLGGGFDFGYLCLFMIAISIPSFAAIILDIIGIIYIFQDRKDFKIDHVKKVLYGLVLILIGFCMQMILPIGFLGPFLTQLGFVFLIVAIAEKKERIYLWTGLVFAGVVVVINIIQRIMGYTKVDDGNLALFLLLICAAIFAFLAGASVFIAYLNTYVNLRNGIIRPGKKKKEDWDE